MGRIGLVVLAGLVVLLARAFVNTLRVQPVKALSIVGAVALAVFAPLSFGNIGLGEIVGGDETQRILEMFGTVGVSVSLCLGVWIALNLFISRSERGWSAFAGLVGAVAGACFFGLLRGNFSVSALVAEPDATLFGSGAGIVGLLEWPIAGALLFGLGFLVTKSIPNPLMRVPLGATIGTIAGVLIAPRTKLWQRPLTDWPASILLMALGAGIGFALARRDQSMRIRNALIGAGVGFGFGAWMLSPFALTTATPWINTIVPLALITAGLAWLQEPDSRQLSRFQERARAFVFLAPALGFLLIALIIPAFRTGVLSLRDRDDNEYVGLDNYVDLFTAADSADISNWQNIFTSRLFFAALALFFVATVIALVAGIRRNGEVGWDGSPTSASALLLGTLLLAFAALSVLRGTFFNNLWWVVTVVSVTTVAGLAAAVLADRATWGEKAAKSLIFMPMAISFVGASIVWRLQYQARDIRKNQTGVLNAVWVALGKLSNSGTPRILVMVGLAVVLALFLYRLARKASAGLPFTGATIGALLSGWLLYRFTGPRLGGFETVDGEIVPETVQFITERPFNNVFLMIILIWTQTGFAMVILSAAIKAVPQEFIEAARVDGATDSQSFFRITLPTILPTVGVVVTTLIVQVTKVFDIVAVAGKGGKFGNDVLANQMVEESFQIGNIGFGAAIAMVMFLLVLPVMIYNITKMQREGA